jgi:hypothetical protein
MKSQKMLSMYSNNEYNIPLVPPLRLSRHQIAYYLAREKSEEISHELIALVRELITTRTARRIYLQVLVRY